MVIKYIPSARHQLLGSGAPQRGLAGSWSWGGGLPSCLPALAGWLAWRLLSWLRCARRRSSRPRQLQSTAEQSRAELRGLAEGSPGRESKQLPPWLWWLMELQREARTSLRSPPALPTPFSLSGLWGYGFNTGSPNNTAFLPNTNNNSISGYCPERRMKMVTQRWLWWLTHQFNSVKLLNLLHR